MRSLRTYAVAALAVSALATGCSAADVHPGQAAVVEGHDISMSTADDFADEFCSLNEPSLKQGDLAFPMVTLRALSLNILIQDELLHRYADERGWTPPASYRQAIAGLDDEATQANVPASDVEAFKKVRTAQEYAAWVYVRAGREVLIQEGKPLDDQQAYDRGRLILREWMEKQDVTVDPRFGTIDEKGDVVAPDGGLSVAVSDLARKGATLPPLNSRDTAYADALPPSQVCG
ncbi:hypothetical protein EKO23_19205 [Nocardioides guangzhouensis]|uniref:Uncharacterized protein n=1 Tax=Nocardioides guangzhouensis TaxID=2497878 RepID=A0A4Q4Z8I2_9ACTN|nr:hypothetical protein [Nocardioides guangzhouensis]RYP83426.1 hypothetical protein EKO23_19205 [Nocardioides guangzhouensis]